MISIDEFDEKLSADEALSENDRPGKVIETYYIG